MIVNYVPKLHVGLLGCISPGTAAQVQLCGITIGVLTKFQNIFFKTCFRFGNKMPDSLHFTKKMSENFGIEQVQL
jgi:hypothetical protein